MHINTKRLIIVVLVLVGFIYVRFYTSVAKDVRILQLGLEDLTPNVLMQKYPLVIEERIVNPFALLHTVFKYMYVYKKINEVAVEHAGHFYQNKVRYMIITSKVDNCSIDISHPNMFVKTNNNEPSHIEIKLHANMCLILPQKWWYRMREPKVLSVISLYDAYNILGL